MPRVLIGRRALLGAALGVPMAATSARGRQTNSGGLYAYVGTYSAPPGRVDPSSGHGQGIHIFRVDRATGAWSPVGVFAHVTSPSALAVNAAGTRMYSTNATDVVDGGASGTVSAFAIDRATAQLRLLDTVASGGTGPTYASIHPGRRHLFVANYSGGTVAVLPLDDDGRIGAATHVVTTEGTVGPTRAANAPPGSFAFSGHDGPHPHMIQADPTGRFVLAPDLGLDRIFVWRFDAATGRLMPNDPPSVALPPGDGPRHFAFHPNGRWLYSMQEEASTVALFDWEPATGRLSRRQMLSSLPTGYAGSSFASGILVSRDGRFVYGGNRLHDSIAIFAVAGDGSLTLVGEEWTRGSYPRSFAFDPSGAFLSVCNQRADDVTTFRVDRDSGRLSFTGQYTPVGSPSDIAFLEV